MKTSGLVRSRAGKAVERFLQASYSKNTRAAYEADVRHFRQWGGSVPADPQTVARYLADHAEKLSFATLSRRLAGLHREHLTLGHASPVHNSIVHATLRGIKRTYRKPQRQVKPILRKDLSAMVKRMQGLRGARDRALLLVGFHGAFRRSELVGLKVADIRFLKEGIVVRLPVSKTDQDGAGRDVPIAAIGGALCAVETLRAWLRKAGITEGAVFRQIRKNGAIGKTAITTTVVARLIKHYAKAVGLNADDYSGHSLRVGLVTSAALAGAATWEIKKQTGHKSDSMVARYIRQAQLFNGSLTRRVAAGNRQGQSR